MTDDTTPPYSPREKSRDHSINVTRLAVIVGVLAAVAGLAGAWFILPYRMDAAEKSQVIFEAKVERRFESNETEQRQQREILIRIDENVKDLRRDARRSTP